MEMVRTRKRKKKGVLQPQYLLLAAQATKHVWRMLLLGLTYGDTGDTNLLGRRGN